MNGQRQGRIFEKPFGIGETIKGEEEVSEKVAPILDIESEIRLACSLEKNSTSDASLIEEMKHLGLERYSEINFMLLMCK